MSTTANHSTDYEMLLDAFGSEYFIFSRIKNKVALSPRQSQELHQLIDERDHFNILGLVNALRRN